MKQTCILVLGMHRSGTSALTGVLQYLNLDLGSRLLGSMPDNEKGFFENSYIVNYNDKLLEKLNSRWDDIFFDYESNKKFITQEDRQELKELLIREFTNSEIFAIKDPRICYLSPLYEEVLKSLGIEVKILLPYRNPIEVARSLEKRNDFTLEKSIALWLNHFLEAEFRSRAYPRFFLKFDNLLDNTDVTIKKIDDFLNTKLYESYLKNQEQISSFLESGLKHNNIDTLELRKGIRFVLEEFLSMYEQDLNLITKKSFDTMRYKNEELRVFFAGLDKTESELSKTNEKLSALIVETENIKEKLRNEEHKSKVSEDELLGIYASKSWMITKPLRTMTKRAKKIKKALGFISKTHTLSKHLSKNNVGKLIYHLRKGNFSLIKKKITSFTGLSQTTIKLDLNNDEVCKTTLVFPRYAEAQVSIIIPVYNQWKFTYRCLFSILKHTNNIKYEIIIADDVSSDETLNISDIVKNIKVVRNEKNLGFLLNCNNAAEHAKGKYILFLNNDTQVQQDWLSSLIELIESDEKTGMVGSKLVYPDGRLQEAGGIIWNDASGWNYGKLDEPTKPEYSYVKEVDYISGASIMIKKDLWREIGGFDERYVPAYFEDADLAFEVRKHGYKVIYQPKSIVVHFEGVSHGTDTGNGIKAYQVKNKEKFFEKWKIELEKSHFSNGKDVFLARDRSKDKKHILIIDHYVPHFDQDAGSRATLHYLKLFIRNGFSVKFLGDNFHGYPETPYVSTLEQIGIEVLYGQYYLKNWEKWLSENGNFFDYFILSRPHISKKYIDIIKRYSNAKIIYFAVDLHYLREYREYQLKQKNCFLENSIYWKKIELELMLSSDLTCFYSSVEVAEINKENKNINALQVPLYIYEKFNNIKYEFEFRKDILFVGGFSHSPNIDAVIWFIKDILPKITEKEISFNLIIVGSNIPEQILEYSKVYDNIIIKGRVSDEELEYLYNTCRLAIAPLRYGAGMKGKVVEALYMGIPLVTTSIGAEGLAEIENVIMISDDAESFAQSIIEIYTKEYMASALSRNSINYCKKWFSIEEAEKCIFANGIDKL